MLYTVGGRHTLTQMCNFAMGESDKLVLWGKKIVYLLLHTCICPAGFVHCQQLFPLFLRHLWLLEMREGGGW